MHLIKSSSLIVLLVALGVVCVAGLKSYEEKCESGVDPATNKTVDDCNVDKFLMCKESRCDCADRADQIWTYQLVKVNSRSKRGSKKGGSKGKIIAGAAVGAGAGYLAAKATSGISAPSIPRPSIGTSKYQKEYSCYTRVSGKCILPGADKLAPTINYNVNVIAPAGSGNSTGNDSTTPFPLPGNLTASELVSITTLRYPPCVPNAACKRPEIKFKDGKLIHSGLSDQRLGYCVCIDGYKADDKDVCVKAGAGRLISSDNGFLLVMISVLASLYKSS